MLTASDDLGRALASATPSSVSWIWTRYSERGLPVDHTTIRLWIWRYVREFVKRSNRFDRFAGGCWRSDQTCPKVRGEWIYLDRALDKTGQTVDFRLAEGAMGAQPKLSNGSQSAARVGRRPPSHSMAMRPPVEPSANAHRKAAAQRHQARNWRWSSRFSATRVHTALEQGHLFSLPCHRSKGALP